MKQIEELRSRLIEINNISKDNDFLKGTGDKVGSLLKILLGTAKNNKGKVNV